MELTTLLILASLVSPTTTQQEIIPWVETANPYEYRPWVRYEQVLEIREQVEHPKEK